MKIPLVNMSVGGLGPYVKRFLCFVFSFSILNDYLMFCITLDEYPNNVWNIVFD